MNKGFTLIELLAVLIILGIIALITIPVVNDALKSTRDKSKQMSAKNYIDAVEKIALSKDVVGVPIKNGIYFVLSDGNICLRDNYSDGSCRVDNINIELKGNRPTEGIVKIINNKVVKASNIKFDKFYANMGYDLEIDISNSISNHTICKAVTSTTKTVGTVPTGNYLIGEEYICNVNKTNKYHFFILNTEGDNVSLIMNNNVKSDGTLDNSALFEWISVDDFVLAGGTEDAIDASRGPLTAVSKLNYATSNWTNLPNLNVSHTDKGNSYGFITFNGKTRLPYYDEIVATGCGVSTCPSWLYVNLGSSYHIADSSTESLIYSVSSAGNITTNSISTSLGLRPVIVLDKTDLS